MVKEMNDNGSLVKCLKSILADNIFDRILIGVKSILDNEENKKLIYIKDLRNPINRRNMTYYTQILIKENKVIIYNYNSFLDEDLIKNFFIDKGFNVNYYGLFN